MEKEEYIEKHRLVWATIIGMVMAYRDLKKLIPMDVKSRAFIMAGLEPVYNNCFGCAYTVRDSLEQYYPIDPDCSECLFAHDAPPWSSCLNGAYKNFIYSLRVDDYERVIEYADTIHNWPIKED
jgi:hypothetical protein